MMVARVDNNFGLIPKKKVDKKIVRNCAKQITASFFVFPYRDNTLVNGLFWLVSKNYVAINDNKNESKISIRKI